MSNPKKRAKAFAGRDQDRSIGDPLPMALLTGLMLLVCAAPLPAQLPATAPRSVESDTLRLRSTDLPALVQRNNPAARSARFEMALSDGDVTTARLRPNPELEVMADVLPLGGGETHPNSRQYGIQLAFPIERGNKRGLRTEVATRAQTLSEQRARDVFRQQMLDVQLAWTELLASQAEERIASATLDNYDQLVTVSRARRDARQISEAELARITVERGRAAVALDTQRGETADARATLARLLGIAAIVVPIDTLAPMPIPDSSAAAPTADPTRAEVLESEALRARADLLAARQSVEVAQSDQRLQHAMGKPDVSLAVEYSMQQYIPLYGASVRVPLPRHNRNQGERQKATVRVAQARDDVERIEREVRVELRRALAIVRARTAALSRFGSTDDGILARALAARTAAEFAYRNGATSLVELLDAERSYDDIRRAHVDAIADVNRSLIHLHFVAGFTLETRP
ncbi:outer membrane efflux protein [Gemmatimonas aurantiaca T-27]|uniref:Outer membrane efflux protein n=2 Tax=Gemmatimonas aurantiaca TaxID=173480 RepID=C1AAN3_GEMAT|nr:outer membrane efflux protein [Gemmatimonas aurantiaca T-27]